MITLCVIMQKLGWVKEEKVTRLQQLAEEITKMINSLIKSMR